MKVFHATGHVSIAITIIIVTTIITKILWLLPLELLLLPFPLLRHSLAN